MGGGGQEEILEKKESNLTARIKRRCGMSRGETAEVQTWEEFKEIRAGVIVQKKEDALMTARDWADHQGTIWTDGSRIDSGAVGAAFASWEGSRWTRRGFYLGRNKEVFDTEDFAIHQALGHLNDRDERDQQYTVFSDSQAAISRVQHDRTGPGQALAKRTIELVKNMVDRGNSVTLRWTPAHAGVEENEQADDMAKREQRRGRRRGLHHSI